MKKQNSETKKDVWDDVNKELKIEKVPDLEIQKDAWDEVSAKAKEELKQLTEKDVWDNVKEELKQKIGLGRESRLVLLELGLILGGALALGFTHVVSPEIVGGGALGLYIAEFFSVCINEKSLGHNLFNLPKSIVSLFANPEKTTVTKPEVKNQITKNSTQETIEKSKNTQASNSSTYGTLDGQLEKASQSKPAQSAKTVQIPERETDALLGSIVYEVSLPQITTINNQESSEATTCCRIS